MEKGSIRISTAVIEQEPRGLGPSSAWPIEIEMSPSEIPATAPIELDKFLAGEDDPCQVIAKIPEGWSYNGYYFTQQAIMDIANTISGNGVTGGLGHVKDEMDFGEVAVVWVGALHKPELSATFVRGYVNPERKEVKRLVRSGVINRVSTDGYASFSDPSDERKITTFNVVSLDLTPRFRNGTESGLAAKDTFHPSTEDAEGKEVNETDMTDENKVPTEEQETPSADQTLTDLQARADELEQALADLKDMLKPLGENPKERIANLLALEEKINEDAAKNVLAEAIADMVEGEDARALVGMLLKPTTGEAIESAKARVQDCLANPELKRLLTSRFADNAPKGNPVKNSEPTLEWE